jgi:hypothetical protein
MRIAAATAGADRDGRNAVADRDVRVGRRESEVWLSADETRRLDGRLHQSMIGWRLAAWTRTNWLDVDAEGARSDGPLRVLIVRGDL